MADSVGTRAGKSKELLVSGGEGYNIIQAEPGWCIYKVKDEDKVAEVPQVPEYHRSECLTGAEHHGHGGPTGAERHQHDDGKAHRGA